MKKREIPQSDIDALKSPEWLIAYLSKQESERGEVNGKPWYTCRLHGHKHPEEKHLRVELRNGEYVAICDRYGVIGDIFATAKAYGDGGSSFPETVRRVAELMGYTLHDDESPRRARRGRRRQPPPQETPRACPPQPAEHADGELGSHLSPAEEAEALEAVRRLEREHAVRARYAAELGLPESVLRFHADSANCGGNGLLGLSPEGKLLYLYTYHDEAGRLRVRYVKTRNKPQRPPYFTTPQKGVRVELWGLGALRREDCRRVIITEGESDCLAVRAAVWSWLDDWSHNSPDTFPPAESWPMVLACPGAGVFNAAWLATADGRKLLAADTILAHDNDEAGREGAAKTARILQAAGARRVFTWCPPAGKKDAREALDPARPWLLADDIMKNKQRFQPINNN